MKNNSIWLKIWVQGKKPTILKKKVSWRKDQEHNSKKKNQERDDWWRRIKKV